MYHPSPLELLCASAGLFIRHSLLPLVPHISGHGFLSSLSRNTTSFLCRAFHISRHIHPVFTDRPSPLAAHRQHRTSYLFSLLSAHELGQWTLCVPTCSRRGAPVTMHDLWGRISAFPHVGRFCFPRCLITPLRIRSPRVQNTYPYIHVSLPLMLFHVAFPLSCFWFIPTSVLLHCPQTHKNIRKIQKTPHIASPVQSFTPPLRGFPSLIHILPSSLLSRSDEAPSHILHCRTPSCSTLRPRR